MTLMPSGANREMANAAYANKRKEYGDSDFALTRRLASEYADWTAQSLASRQTWMAKQATGIWRIAQLS